MFRKRTTLGILLLVAASLLAISACSSGASASSAKGVTVKQTPIKAQLNGEIVSILASEVDKYINSRFMVKTATDTISFMAYRYDDQLYVRADICPPCGSESFTLTNDTLVCDACGTVFNAKTGVGIRGACVKFAKQSVAYEVTDGNIVMKGTDLESAFQNTVFPKKS